MIKPLIEIKNIPMSIEYKINKAHFEIINNSVPVEITQNDNVFEMRMQPTKLNMDTVSINHSSGNNKEIQSDGFVNQGINASYEISSSFSEKGSFKINIKILDSAASEISLRKFQSDLILSKSSWEPQDLSIKYDINKLNLDTDSQIKFVPGNIEFIIKEYPRVEIKYLGDPIYVPPSANPNYKQIDTLV